MSTELIERVLGTMDVARRGPRHYGIVNLSVETARRDFLITMGDWNTIIFTSVPTRLRIKLTDNTSDEITIETAQKYWQEEPILRFFISHDAIITLSKLELFIGRNIDLSFVNIKPSMREIWRSTTPIGLGTRVESSPVSVSDLKEVVVSCFSNVAGTLRVQFGWDGISWDVEFVFPIDAGIGRGEIIAARSRFVRIVFEKSAAVNQTIFSIGAFARS